MRCSLAIVYISLLMTRVAVSACYAPCWPRSPVAFLSFLHDCEPIRWLIHWHTNLGRPSIMSECSSTMLLALSIISNLTFCILKTSQIYDWIVKYKYVNGRATAAAETLFGPSIVVGESEMRRCELRMGICVIRPSAKLVGIVIICSSTVIVRSIVLLKVIKWVFFC